MCVCRHTALHYDATRSFKSGSRCTARTALSVVLPVTPPSLCPFHHRHGGFWDRGAVGIVWIQHTQAQKPRLSWVLLRSEREIGESRREPAGDCLTYTPLSLSAVVKLLPEDQEIDDVWHVVVPEKQNTTHTRTHTHTHLRPRPQRCSTYLNGFVPEA